MTAERDRTYLGGIDLERVWDAIAISLPELALAVRDLLDELGEP